MAKPPDGLSRVATLPDKQRTQVIETDELMNAVCRFAKDNGIGPFTVVNAMLSKAAQIIAAANDTNCHDAISTVEHGFRAMVEHYRAEILEKTEGSA